MTFRLKAASGPHTGRTFDLGDNTAIGSSEEADIRLRGVDERHARIVFDGDLLTVEPAGEVWVNGDPVSRRALRSGDEIRFGEHRFVLQAPGLRPPSKLRETGRRRISPWTWVAIGLVAAGSFAAVAAYVVMRL